MNYDMRVAYIWRYRNEIGTNDFHDVFGQREDEGCCRGCVNQPDQITFSLPMNISRCGLHGSSNRREHAFMKVALNMPGVGICLSDTFAYRKYNHTCLNLRLEVQFHG